MFGCHKCEHCGKSFPSYEESPCSKCSTVKDPAPISHYDEDPASFASLIVMHPAYEEEPDDRFELAMSALGRCVKRLVSMKDSHPETFKFVIAKMDSPSLSYSEIATMFNCRKQNVMYHFKKAVGILPELSHALIVDRRFMGGKPSPISPRQAKLRFQGEKIA